MQNFQLLVFVVLGVVLSTTFGLAGGLARIINIAAGAIVILLGLNIIFDFWKVLNAEKRFHLKHKPGGAVGALLVGMAFGAGWSPCIGPILGSILLLAGTTGKLGQGLVLLVVYSAGLGLPFILTGFFFSAALRQLERIKPHLNTIRVVSGIFLLVVGLFILLGRLRQFNIFLFSLASGLRRWESTDPAGVRMIFGLSFLLAGLIVAFLYLRRILRDRRAIQQAIRQVDPPPTAPGMPPDNDGSHAGLMYLRPVRLLFMFLFFAAAVLSLGGWIDISTLVFFWLNFQGI